MRRIFIAFLDVALQLVIIYLILTAIIARPSNEMKPRGVQLLPDDIPEEMGRDWGSPMIIIRFKQEDGRWMCYFLDDRVNSEEDVKQMINQATGQEKDRISEKYGPFEMDFFTDFRERLRERIDNYRTEVQRDVRLHVRAQAECPYGLISKLYRGGDLNLPSIYFEVNLPERR